ncbi:MAG: hypothetical protein J5846_03095 [Desulfovibrio sp.]|nr:hypothetical protein [Desulfovibrio sp.]
MVRENTAVWCLMAFFSWTTMRGFAMKKLSRLFLALFSVCMLAMLTSVSSAQADPMLVVTINNYTNESVSLALARENGYDTSDNITVGWYNCGPRQTKTVKPLKYHPDNNYYWFAVKNGRVIASGKDFSGWIVRGKAFKSVHGRKPGGGTRVGFKTLNEKNGRCTINIGKH